MLKQKYEYTARDYKMYKVCHSLGQLSSCNKRKVGAVVATKFGEILGSGYNLVDFCNNSCNHTCAVIHAEAMSIRTCDNGISYVNRFPCRTCQEMLYCSGVRTVFVFGEQGNKDISPMWLNDDADIIMLPDLPSLLLSYNGVRSARQVLQGELAELITAISNHDARDDRPETKAELVKDIAGEVTDVELQLYILAKSLDYNSVEPKEAKWNKLIAKFKPIFFPGKDL